MATISTNTTLTLDGVTTIDVNGVDQYAWTSQTLESLFISPASGGLTLTLNLAADWVAGPLKVSGSLTTIINDDSVSGSRYCDLILLGSGGDTVSLSRTSTEALSTGAGDDLIEIEEVWIGWLHAGAGNDTVTLRSNASVNTLDLGEGTNTVTVELGTYGVDTISGRAGVDTVYAYADVGFISTRSGNDHVETEFNWVELLDTGSGADTVIAGGSVKTINTSYGADSITTLADTWTNLINSGDSNDVLLISGKSDFIDSGNGDDTITTGTDWIGNIDAGAGRDTVTLGGGTTIFVDLGHDADKLNVGIQLDPADRIVAKGGSEVWDAGGTDRDLVSFAGFTDDVQVRLDLESARSTQGNLTLIDFEDATGGSGNDLLTGDGQDNVLRGAAGNDTLVGGAGRDALFGGLGADTFRFRGMDSRPDLISDFRRAQGDSIDLSAIDANSGLSGNQAFAFIGTQEFNSVAGELRLIEGNGWVRLAGDSNGDGVAEFTIVLQAIDSSDIDAADILL